MSAERGPGPASDGAPPGAARPGRAAEPLGVILAGGQNRRYGGHKAFAEVGGRPIVERVLDALRDAVPAVGIVANEPAVYGRLALPMRADVRPGAGALGGVLTALVWAAELGRPAALVVACDMPFVAAPLLRALLAEAAATGADAVLPESGGRRGVEPLCAVYRTACIPAIERALDEQRRQAIAFHGDVVVRRLPLAAVRRFGDPDLLFSNVNTPEQRADAGRLLEGGGPRPEDAGG